MNTYTDTQLKQALAKMLPEQVNYNPNGQIYWNFKWCSVCGSLVNDTELLHLCWLVEETLNDTEWIGYSANLEIEMNDYSPRYKFEIHTTWQQRVIALAQVKGIKIV